MGKFVSKLRALLKAPLFYISVAATAAVAAVACCTVLFWSSPKQSPKNPALTAEQKLFLQQIAETTSQQPTTVEFSCDVSAALAEDEQITEVHHVSESFVVVTIQKTETDGETVISTTTTIEIIENNNGTAAKVAGLNYPVKNSAGLGYSFVSCDGTNIVLSCTQNIQNVGQKTSQVLISSNGTSLIGANAYDEIVCLPSNTLLLLNHSDVDNDGIPDDEDVFDVNFAKISGSTITVGEHIRYVMGYEVVENFIAINSLDKFSVYFINNLPTEVFTIASSAEGKSIQELIDEGFNLLVQDFKVEQINSNLYYINQTLTGSEQDYTTKRDYGNVVMYYKNANYIVNAKSQSVNAMTDQTSTFSYKVLANDCYEQTKTAPNGKSTTTYFNASGEEISMPDFEILYSFGNTFIAQSEHEAGIYDLNLNKLVQLPNDIEFFVNGDLIFCKGIVRYNVFDKYGNTIIQNAHYVSSEIGNKVLFGSYEIWQIGEEEYEERWTWKNYNISEKSYTNVSDIDITNQQKVPFSDLIIAKVGNTYKLTTKVNEIECREVLIDCFDNYYAICAGDTLFSIELSRNYTMISYSVFSENELSQAVSTISGSRYTYIGSEQNDVNDDHIQLINWSATLSVSRGGRETWDSIWASNADVYNIDYGVEYSFNYTPAAFKISTITVNWKYYNLNSKKASKKFTPVTSNINKSVAYNSGTQSLSGDSGDNVTIPSGKYFSDYICEDSVWIDFYLEKINFNISYNTAEETPETKNSIVWDSPSRTITYGQKVTLPTYSGISPNQRFIGWFTAPNGGGTQVSNDTVYYYPQTLYAHWETKIFTVTFSANGGSVSPTTKEVTWNNAYGTLPTPIKDHYDFGGWYLDSNFTNRVTESTNVSTFGNHTLYAKWTLHQYSITCNIPYTTTFTGIPAFKYGSFGSKHDSIWFLGTIEWDEPIVSKTFNYTIDSTSSGVTAPTYDYNGYVFDHWEVSSISENSYGWTIGGTFNPSDAFSKGHYGDVTLTAVYKVPVYVNSEANYTQNVTYYSPQNNDKYFITSEFSAENPNFAIIGYYCSDDLTFIALKTQQTINFSNAHCLVGSNMYFNVSYIDSSTSFTPGRLDGGTFEPAKYTNPTNMKWDTIFKYPNSVEYVALSFTATNSNRKLQVSCQESIYGNQVYLKPVIVIANYNTITLQETVYHKIEGNYVEFLTGGSVVVPKSGALSDFFGSPAKQGNSFVGFDDNFQTEERVTDFSSLSNGSTLHVIWEPNTYSVAFNGNGATSGGMDSQSFTYGIAQNLSANSFQKTGYTFKGWATSSGGAVVYTNTQSVSNLTTTNQGVVTLYAVWQANTYNATFDANGGSLPSGTTNPKQVTYDRTYGTLPIPLNRTGYTFNGWYTLQSDGDQITTSSIVKITENSTLYAHWTANTYDVTFNANGGKFSDNETTKTIQQTYDESYSLPNVSLDPPTEGGPYYFAGWFTDDGIQITTSSIVKITENTTLYAHWKTHVYYVQFNANYAGSSATYTQQFTYNQEQALATTTLSKTGYHIVGWATTSDGVKVYNPNEEITSNLTDEPNATVNLYAIWAPNTYLVVFNGNGATSGTMQNQSFTYDEAQNLSANSFQKTGYHFVGWLQRVGMLTIEYENEEEVSNITSENGATIELFAQWELNTYSVSFNGNDATSGSMDNQLFTYSYFASLTTNSFQKTGHNFEGWATSSDGAVAYADGQVVSNLTTTNGGVVTLYAVWSIATYSINLDSKLYNIDGTQNKAATTAGTTTIYQKYDTGYYSDGDCETEIAETTIPTLTGYTFGGYYTEKNGNGTQCINADGDVISTATQFTSSTLLYASWQPNTYEVIFNGNGAPSGEMENQSFTYDEAQNLSANLFSRTYFNFVGWATTQNAIEAEYEDEESVINLTTTANGSVTLYAVWEAQEFTILFHKNIGEDPEVTYVQKVTLFNKNELYLQTIEQIITENGNFAYGTSSFAGWAISSAAANTIDNSANLAFITDAQQNDVVDLYAVWFFAVTRDANGPTYGADKPTTSEINLLHNGSNKADVVAALSSTSLYTFMGWNTAQDGTGTQITAENVLTLFGSANNSIYAQWQAKTFNIQYVVKERDDTQHGETDQYKTLESYQLKDENGNTITTNSLPQTFTAESLTTLPIVFIDNYDFRGYSYTISGTTHTNIESLPTGDETITEGITVVLSFHRLYSIAVQYISDTTFSEVTKYVQSDGSLANVPYYGFNKEHQTTFECTNINVFSLNGKDYLGVQNTIAGTYYRFLYVTRSDIGGSTYTESQILGSVGFANSNTTIKFHYVERINILFNPNGGTAVSTIEIDKGSSLAAEEIRLGRTFEIAPTKENLTLGGWRFGNNEYVAAADVKNHLFNQRITLNAEWLAVITYQVVDETGAIVAEETSTQTVVENTSTSTLAIHNKWGTTNHQNNSYYSSDNSFFNGGDLELAIFKINNNLYRFKEVAGAQTLTENTLLNIVLVKRVELSFESQKEINASVQAEIDSTLSAVQLPDFAYISNESTSSTLSFTIFADRNVQINYININGLVIDGTTNYVLSGWDIGEEEAWEQGSMVFSQNTTLTAIWQDAGRFVSIGVFSAETGEIMFENIFYLPTQIIEGVPEYYGNIVITFNDATQTVTISGESVQTQIGSMEFEIPSISLPVEGEFKPVGLLATYDLLSGFNDSLISSQDQAANIIEISASDFASKNFQYVYILYERVDD